MLASVPLWPPPGTVPLNMHPHSCHPTDCHVQMTTKVGPALVVKEAKATSPNRGTATAQPRAGLAFAKVRWHGWEWKRLSCREGMAIR